ncbi:hypothetical protein HRbin17_01453 [bacterium HR17]|uniref:DUF456 domain-containing protein n=1 Tax=Candidatus Fervidibacter japonicus TaxID=2035412 RepID=A0A2H5XCN6_9BACT|nr:hypothetical protein HRbin17_01453 [bacterium HR17]
MDWLLLAKVMATLLAAVAATGIVLGLPTTLLAWLGLLIVAAVSGFQAVSGAWLLGTFIGCVLMEIADNLLAMALVRKLGATKGSATMALVGSLLGGLVGGAVGGLAGPVGSAASALVGAFGGGYAAVYAWERYRHQRPHADAHKIAFGTVVGRIIGIVVKLVWVIVLVWLSWGA